MIRKSVSVIIPCYNRAHTVGRAIESALGQGYDPLQIVVADDESSDDSVAVASRYPVTVIACRHAGAAATRNAGVAAATGEYIAFLDADDSWTDGSLSRRIPLLDQDSRVGLVFGDAEVVDPGTSAPTDTYLAGRTEIAEMAAEPWGADGLVIVVDPLPYLLRRSFICTSTVIVRRTAWEEAGGFNQSLSYAEDLDLWMRIGESFLFAYTRAPSARYECRDDSMSRKGDNVMLGMAQFWARASARYAGRYPKLRRTFITNLGAFSYEAGRIAAARHDAAQARHYYGAAIRCLPTYKSAWIGYLGTLFNS